MDSAGVKCRSGTRAREQVSLWPYAAVQPEPNREHCL
jgi:hypothetical protein